MRKESDGTTTAFKQSTKSSPSRWRAHNSERAQSQNAHQSAVLQCKFENSLRRPQKHSRERKKIASLKISAKSPAKIVRAQNPDQRKRDADFRHRGPGRRGSERGKEWETERKEPREIPRARTQRARVLSSSESETAAPKLGGQAPHRKKSTSALLLSEKPCIFLTKS